MDVGGPVFGPDGGRHDIPAGMWDPRREGLQRPYVKMKAWPIHMVGQ